MTFEEIMKKVASAKLAKLRSVSIRTSTDLYTLQQLVEQEFFIQNIFENGGYTLTLRW